MDFYDILGVGKDATQEQIKIAYRKKALEYHPDRNPGDNNALEMFKKVQQAYENLYNTNKRSNYDSSRPQRPTPKKPTPKKKQQKVYNRDRFSIHDAPPPKYDLWGRPLSEEEQKAWKLDNADRNPSGKGEQDKIHQGWRDSMKGHYESSSSPELR